MRIDGIFVGMKIFNLKKQYPPLKNLEVVIKNKDTGEILLTPKITERKFQNGMVGFHMADKLINNEYIVSFIMVAKK